MKLLTQSLTSILALGLATTSGAELIKDGSFEAPTTGGIFPWGNSVDYTPIHPNWTFFQGAGTQLAIETGVHFATPGRLDGQKIAFLQGKDSWIGQAVLFPADGTYELDYYVAGRQPQYGNTGGSLTYDVLLDGIRITEDATVDSQNWTLRSFSFSESAGMHELKFLGVAVPAHGFVDQTAFLDAVSLTGPASTPDVLNGGSALLVLSLLLGWGSRSRSGSAVFDCLART